MTQSNRRPNVLITGTPGTGKTTTCQLFCERTGLHHVNVGDLVKQKGLHQGRDTQFDSFLLDEDQVCDELEPLMQVGGQVVDFHTCDFFPERWFNLVVVLQTETHHLYDRLVQRGYKLNKVQENVECEIMQVVLEEAKESYQPEIVRVWSSNSIEEMEENVERLVEWFESFIQE